MLSDWCHLETLQSFTFKHLPGDNQWGPSLDHRQVKMHEIKHFFHSCCLSECLVPTWCEYNQILILLPMEQALGSVSLFARHTDSPINRALEPSSHANSMHFFKSAPKYSQIIGCGARAERVPYLGRVRHLSLEGYSCRGQKSNESENAQRSDSQSYTAGFPFPQHRSNQVAK